MQHTYMDKRDLRVERTHPGAGASRWNASRKKWRAARADRAQEKGTSLVVGPGAGKAKAETRTSYEERARGQRHSKNRWHEGAERHFLHQAVR